VHIIAIKTENLDTPLERRLDLPFRTLHNLRSHYFRGKRFPLPAEPPIQKLAKKSVLMQGAQN
jgi:hypothetical protein